MLGFLDQVVSCHRSDLLLQFIFRDDFAFFRSKNDIKDGSDGQGDKECDYYEHPQQVREVRTSTQAVSLTDSLGHDLTKYHDKPSRYEESHCSRCQVGQEDRQKRIHCHVSK